MRAVRDVTARGVRMRVTEAGTEHRQAVVLVHGFLASHLTFDDVIDTLAQRFHVIAPDLPGFGDSEKPAPSRFNYSVEAFAESIADIIAAYGLGRACVLGHGLGGAVAMTLAAHHAELVNRLVVIAPLVYAERPHPRLRVALWPVVGTFSFKQLYGRRAFRGYFRDAVYSSRIRLPTKRVDALYEAFNTPSARQSAYAVLRTMLDTRAVVARVSRIRHSTLILWGRDDATYPASSALRLARQMNDAHLEIFDAGHAPHEERPAEFIATIQEFFEGGRG
ncbi:MAG: alpha/beta hydrolase [Myxococcota bacterium]